jgi:hypothetical protein
MLMNLSEIVMLLLFLAVFVVVPVVLALIGSRHRSINASLPECPHCGAQNYKTKEHCYCCGFGVIFPQSNGADAVLIQRVKQADEIKMRRGVGTQTSEGKLLEKIV